MRVPSAPSLLIAGLAIGSNAFAAPVDTSGRSPNPERSPLLVASPSPAFQDSPKFPSSPSFPAGFRRRDPAAYGALGKRSPQLGNGLPSGLGIVDSSIATTAVGSVVPLNSLGLPGVSQVSSLGNTVSGVAGGLPVASALGGVMGGAPSVQGLTGALGGAQGGLAAVQGLGNTVGGATGGLLGGQGGLLGSVVPAVGGTLSSVAHTVDGILPLGLEGILGGGGPLGAANGVLSAAQNLPGTLGNVAADPLGSNPLASTLSSGLPISGAYDPLKAITDPYLQRVQGTVNPADILGLASSETRAPIGQLTDATYDPRLDPNSRASQVAGGAENRKEGLTDIASNIANQVKGKAQSVSDVPMEKVDAVTGQAQDEDGNVVYGPPINIWGTFTNPNNGRQYRASDFPSKAAYFDAQVHDLTPEDYTAQKWQSYQPDGWIYDIDDPDSPFVPNPYARKRPPPPPQEDLPMTPEMPDTPTMPPAPPAPAKSAAGGVTAQAANILGGGLVSGLGQIQGVVNSTPIGAIASDPIAAVTAKLGGGNPIDNVMQSVPSVGPTSAAAAAVGQVQGALGSTPVGAVASDPIAAVSAKVGMNPVHKVAEAVSSNAPIGAATNGLGQVQGVVNGTPAGAVAADPFATVSDKVAGVNPADNVMQAVPAAAPTGATSVLSNMPVPTPVAPISPPSEQNTYSTVVEAIKAAAAAAPTSATSLAPDAAGRAADATGVVSSKTGIPSPMNTIKAARRWIRERF